MERKCRDCGSSLDYDREWRYKMKAGEKGHAYSCPNCGNKDKEY